MIKKFFVFVCIAMVALTVNMSEPEALAITLKRIVFEGSKRAEVLTLINNGDQAKTYRIGWRHFKMTHDKNFVVMTDDELAASPVAPSKDMVVYSPRRVTVPPRSSQRIRIMLRMPGGVQDGEYRSHLWIRTEGDVEEVKKQAQEYNKKTGRRGGATVAMLPGVTLPVIVRKGALDASVDFQNVRVTNSPGFVSAQYSLVRNGQRSVYGELDYICNPGTASEYLLKRNKGIAVYTEVGYRNINVKFEKALDAPACTSMRILFTETEESTRREKLITGETTVSVSSV